MQLRLVSNRDLPVLSSFLAVDCLHIYLGIYFCTTTKQYQLVSV